MVYLTLSKLFSSLLSWTAKEEGDAGKKKKSQEVCTMSLHSNEAAIKRSGRVSYKGLGTNRQSENRKYEHNLKNLCGCQKYTQVLHEKEVASLFWKLKSLLF